MADAKRKLMIEILSDASGIKKGFGQAEGSAAKFGSSLAKTVGVTVSVAAGVDLIKDSIQGAIADEASVGALALQMKNLSIPEKNSKGVEDFIGKLSRARGVADDELRPAFAQLIRSSGDVEAAQSDLNLAMDIAAARHISVAEASDLLAKANNGNTKGLKSLGISLKDVNGDTLDMPALFEKLRTTFKGAGEEAANTAEGKLKKMTVGFDEMKEGIGKALLPMMEKLVGFVTTTLLPGVEKVGAWLADHKPVLIAFAAVVGVALVSAFAAWAASAIAAAAATVAAMLPVLAPIAAVAAAVYLIIDNWDVIVEFFQKLPGRILGFLKDLPDLLLDLGKKLLQGLLDGVEWLATTGLKAYFIDIPLKILEWLGDLASLLLPAGKAILQGFLDGVIWLATTGLKAYFIDIPLKLLEWIGDANLWLLGKGKDILLGLVHGLESAWSDLFTWFFNLPSRIWQLLVDAGDWLIDFGKDLVKGIVAGIKAAPGAIRDALIDLVPGGGSTIDKILKYIPFGGAFAEGGLVPGPKGAPRMILAHGGEFVASNAMLAGGSGGSGVTNYITINATDPDSVIAAIQRWTRQNGPIPVG